MAHGETFFPVLKNELRAVRTALWFRPGVFCIAAALGAAILGAVDAFLRCAQTRGLLDRIADTLLVALLACRQIRLRDDRDI